MNIRYLRKSLLITNIVLTAVVFYLSYTIFLEWKTGNNSGPISNHAVPEQREGHRDTAGKTNPQGTYQTIIRRDIFDTISNSAKPAPVVQKRAEVVQPTQLNLKLNGTMVGDQTSYAVIADGSTGREGIYTIDDSIQNARIVDILPDRIILDANNQKESLVLFPENMASSAESIEKRRTPRGQSVLRRLTRAMQSHVNRLPSR